MMLTCLDMFLERFETALERLLPVINHMIIDLKLLYYITLQQVQPDLQGNVVSCYTPQYISNIFRWFVCFHLTKSILLSAFTTFKLVAQTSTDIPQKISTYILPEQACTFSRYLQKYAWMHMKIQLHYIKIYNACARIKNKSSYFYLFFGSRWCNYMHYKPCIVIIKKKDKNEGNMVCNLLFFCTLGTQVHKSEVR